MNAIYSSSFLMADKFSFAIDKEQVIDYQFRILQNIATKGGSEGYRWYSVEDAILASLKVRLRYANEGQRLNG